VNAENARVVVIGGGVIGCSILYELARHGIAGILVEAEPDLCEGTSKANSGIVHTGFDAAPGSLESRMLSRARERWPDLVEELGVPFLRVGALMLARTDEERTRLRNEIAANAAALGVQTELMDRSAVREIAPYVADDVIASLSIPDEAVIDPFWLTRGFAEAAVAGGAEVRLGWKVSSLQIGDESITVGLADGSRIEAQQVIDAAGLRADEVAGLAGDGSFRISPRKGQFLVVEETSGVDRIVLPIPGPLGKGMLVTPIVFGGLLLGPTAVDLVDKEDTAADGPEGARIMAACRAMVPAIEPDAPVRQFAGLRHVSSTGTFVIRPSDQSDRLYFAAGIRSTGISASPAIAEAVVADVRRRRGWVSEGRPRHLAVAAPEIPERAGEIACLCRAISRSEVEAACRRLIQPATLDAVKRRGGAMFGDCQGNLCAVDIGKIVAAERGVPIQSLEKHRRGSWLWTAAHDGSVTMPAPPAIDRLDGEDWDLVVVGAGVAGRACATVARDRLRVLLVDRSTPRVRAAAASSGDMQQVAPGTVVGLSPAAEGWAVLIQDDEASTEIRSRAVVVATGSYVKPREHRAIAGPRPAGIMTGDLAWSALAAGLLPGHAVGLLAGPDSELLAGALTRAGARVIHLAELPLEVRGAARLEAIRSRSGWIAADALVLDDTRLAQTFLLRPLGLVDGVPGRRAPVDTAGSLGLDGLWATGCCVDPDPGHAGCARHGETVGRAVLARLSASSPAAPALAG
jgi:glycerol-3-phosphate dehydrogenase